jgi:hypothetical protein
MSNLNSKARVVLAALLGSLVVAGTAGAAVTQITSGPADGAIVGTPTVTFTFTVAGANSLTEYRCRIDNDPWVLCGSGLSGSYTTPPLSEGQHTFRVRNNTSGQPGGGGAAVLTEATRTFTVDLTAPGPPTITSGPTGTVASSSATFGFVGAESGGSFQCRLDGGSWTSCSSPHTYSGLAEGPHTFEVRQLDAAGNASPPASRTWTVAFPASVSSLSASCAGDTVTATAVASGSNGQTFTLSLLADGSPTGDVATITLDGSSSYQASFNIASYSASSYKVVSSTGAESNAVAATSCGPGDDIPEAPLSLLLPLSLLATFALALRYRMRRS